MSIIFDDSELRTASKEFVEIPGRVDILDQQDAQTDQAQADALAQDEANIVFYDNYLNIINRYHEELQNLNGTVKTNYNTTDLINAAKIAPGNIHFIISPPWINFSPKIHNSNLGIPTSYTPANEIDSQAAVQAAKDQLLSGYSDGATTSTLNTAYAAGEFEVDTGTGPAVGNRVLINNSIYGIVTSVAVGVPTMMDDTITINEIVSGSAGMGTTCKNFDPGFTNDEREGTIPSHAPGYQSYLQGILDTQVSNIEVYLQAQKVALLANDAVNPDESEIDQAKLDVQAAIDAIDAFQAAPGSGAGVGRFGDTIIVPLQSMLTTRAIQVPARALQISTRLGSVSQAGDGAFTGSGQYFNLFKWVDLRLSKSGGSLTKYYSFDLIKNFISSTQGTLNNKQSEYGLVILAVILTADADGTKFITVGSVTGWNIGDSVFLLDDDVGITTLPTTIVGISGLVIELASNASLFTANKVARLVKYI